MGRTVDTCGQNATTTLVMKTLHDIRMIEETMEEMEATIVTTTTTIAETLETTTSMNKTTKETTTRRQSLRR